MGLGPHVSNLLLNVNFLLVEILFKSGHHLLALLAKISISSILIPTIICLYLLIYESLQGLNSLHLLWRTFGNLCLHLRFKLSDLVIKPLERVLVLLLIHLKGFNTRA